MNKKKRKEEVVNLKTITQEFIDMKFSKNQHQIKDKEAPESGQACKLKLSKYPIQMKISCTQKPRKLILCHYM